MFNLIWIRCRLSDVMCMSLVFNLFFCSRANSKDDIIRLSIDGNACEPKQTQSKPLTSKFMTIELATHFSMCQQWSIAEITNGRLRRNWNVYRGQMNWISSDVLLQWVNFIESHAVPQKESSRPQAERRKQLIMWPFELRVDGGVSLSIISYRRNANYTIINSETGVRA